MSEVINIPEKQAAGKFLQKWDELTQEKIWRELRMSEKRGREIVATTPEDLAWFEVNKNYLLHQAKLYLKTKIK